MPPVDPTELRLRVIPAIAEIDAAAWDACANPTAAKSLKPESEALNQNQCDLSDSPYNPFISYDFLHSLEASGSASHAGSGPSHRTEPELSGNAGRAFSPNI